MVAFILFVTILALIISVPYSKKLKAEKRNNDLEALRRLEFNANLSANELEAIERVLAYTGKSHFFDVTEQEFTDYQLAHIAEGFEGMPGWNTWDKSIHRASGQYERIERAFGSNQQDMKLLRYDPTIQRAKIAGNTDVYIAGHQGCSCPDFKARKLPCKHMYYLMAELDGNPYGEICNDAGEPLNGINFFTTGRFPEYGHTKGIVQMILESGGQWTSEWKEADVIVVGSNPSYSIMEKNKECGLLETSPDDIQSLFADM